jgi:hypothetical protein
MKRFARWPYLVALVATVAFASAQILGLDGASIAAVDTNGNMRVNEGPSRRVTYLASSSALVTTALFNLTVESEVARGFKVSQICVGVSNATAAAAVTVTVNRRSTASSAGTASTQEGTGADSMSKMDPADSSWSGVVRRTATLGTIGPTLDQWGFTVGELGAGTADGAGPAMLCKAYGLNGEKLPTVVAGTANGLSVNVSAPGAGGLAAGSISITFITET